MNRKVIVLLTFFFGIAATPLCAAQRVPWTTSRIVGSPDQPYGFRLERQFDSLSFTNPIDLAFLPELDRWFVAEQGGKVVSFDAHGGKRSIAADFAGKMGPEGTFYALTFDPNFRSNRYIYVCYALKPDLPAGSRVSRFKVRSAAEPWIDLATEEILITWVSGGHNGCCLKFGNDGYLYISTGDAAGPNPPDPLKTGQNVADLLSSILRIDVHNSSAGRKYLIPADNPFVGHLKARPEIWAYGFRNPWRMGFDKKTGDLWVGDVGWELWELIYKVQRGGNYGWSIMEGRQPVLPNDPVGPTPILPPTKAHPHSEAASITGGIVYYGQRFPKLTGAFIYGDWETGKIWGLRTEGDKTVFFEELCDSTTRIVAFGEDAAGEVFVLDYNGGIYRLAANTTTHSPQDFPGKLSETGLFANVKELTSAPGVYPFEVNAPMWNDFGIAHRLVALPGETSIDTREQLWRFPSNAVLARTIILEMEQGKPGSARRIETQLLHHTGDGWGAYTYRWNAEQTDAELVPAEGADQLLHVKDARQPGSVRLQPWRFASRTECLRCHNTWCGTALAFQPEQLGTQFDELADLKLIAAKPTQPKKQLVSPYDPAVSLDARARSYLHINCSHCHRENAGGSVPSIMNNELPLEKMRSVDARPILGDLGLVNGKVIAPGEPFSSVLLFRTSATGRSRMPYIGSELVDEEGTALLRDWIASLRALEQTRGDRFTALQQELNAGSPVISRTSNYLANSSSALMLAHALAGPSVLISNKEQIAHEAVKQPNPLISELFEGFLPAGARSNLLQLPVRSEEILALRGDAARGAELLCDAARLSCLQCHQFQEKGRDFGPALKDAAKNKSREQILDAILHPSREVAPEFVLSSVELTDGEFLSGIIKIRSSNLITVRDQTGTDHQLPISKIKAIRPQQLSAMPEGLLTGLNSQEVADILDAISHEANINR